ncbi:MAG: hypothetical protein HY361_00155 [Candidatus Aenigmarchaeota archaeon]|nr:hypothetical protein [Candidatus Aenigmarchaeota archaeon]
MRTKAPYQFTQEGHYGRFLRGPIDLNGHPIFIDPNGPMRKIVAELAERQRIIYGNNFDGVTMYYDGRLVYVDRRKHRGGRSVSNKLSVADSYSMTELTALVEKVLS